MSDDTKKLYLAHPYIARRKAIQFIDKLKENGITNIVNPFDDIGYKEELTKTKEGCKKLMEMDLDLIRKCDGVLMYVPFRCPLIGCSCEAFYASYILRKRVYVYTQWMGIKEHPWINAIALIFTDVNRLIEKLKKDGF